MSQLTVTLIHSKQITFTIRYHWGYFTIPGTAVSILSLTACRVTHFMYIRFEGWEGAGCVGAGVQLDVMNILV